MPPVATAPAPDPELLPAGRAPAASPDLIDADALDVIGRARRYLAQRDGVLETLVLAALEPHLDRSVPTMGVSLTDTRVARLTANPDFVVDIGVEGTAFVLAHEAFHIVLGHLQVRQFGHVAQIARETVVNHWVLRSGHRGLPVATSTGEPTGVDPQVIHQIYTDRVADAVLDYDDFVATDVVCARELARIPRETLADAPGRGSCRHESDDPTGDELPTPASSAAAALDEILELAVDRALRGDDRLHAQLRELHEATADAPAWDRVGGHELRGVTDRLGATGFWRHHLRAVLGRVLRDRRQFAYDRKTGWWDTSVLAAAGITLPDGTGMPLQQVARPRTTRNVAIYVDTSGSMTDDVLQHVAATVGPIADTEVAWHTFDHDVHPFVPGDSFVGGGGTDFDAVRAHVEALDPEPDAVLVLTDGYAPPITPAHPDRWIWVLTEDADPWPSHAGMHTVPINLPSARHDPIAA